MSRGKIIKLKPGEMLRKPTKKDRSMLDSITSVWTGEYIQYNLRHYTYRLYQDGWLVVRRKPSKTK